MAFLCCGLNTIISVLDSIVADPRIQQNMIVVCTNISDLDLRFIDSASPSLC